LEHIFLETIPLTKAIGVTVDDAEPGYIKASMARSHIVMHHLNTFHAGALYTFAESVAIITILASLELSQITAINEPVD